MDAVALNGKRESRSSQPGFAATISGANLPDLVQMECMSRAPRVVRITSEHRVGYLYFRDGRIVHAATPDLVGERAALEILSWADGTFEPCQLRFPSTDSIQTSAQHLLLQAAQVRDEGGRGNLLEFPNGRAQHAETSGIAAISQTTVRGSHEVVEVGPDGRILGGEQGDESLAGTAAYAVRLAHLIGDTLGLSGLRSIECQLEGSRCTVDVRPDGVLVATKSRREASRDIFL